MKQLKFLMVAFTLLMGVSLTSCLDSGNSESTYDGGGYVRTKHFMGSSYFVDLEGNQYFPTSESLAIMKSNFGFDIETTDLAIIYFKNVETLASGENSSTKSKNIKLVSAEAIDSYEMLVLSKSEMETTVADNAPIYTLNPVDNYGNTYKPLLYGAQMVVLPVYWKMEQKSETLAQHKFNLVYVDEMQKDNSELVLCLRHDKGTDTKTEAFAFRYKAYDIQSIMERIKGETGMYPSKIIIKAKVNTDGTTMPEEYTDYEIDSSILNQ